MLMAPAEVADLSAYLGSSANINKIFAKFAGSAMVLIDGPPLAESGDAFALSRLVDGVLVVASGTRFRGVAEGNLCEDLRDFGARILGVVAVP